MAANSGAYRIRPSIDVRYRMYILDSMKPTRRYPRHHVLFPRVPFELRDEVDAAARAQGTTCNAWIVAAIQSHLRRSATVLPAAMREPIA